MARTAKKVHERFVAFLTAAIDEGAKMARKRTPKINRAQMAWKARKLGGFKENGRWYFPTPADRDAFLRTAKLNGYYTSAHGIAAAEVWSV